MIANCFFDCVTVGCWNIGGIYEKINGDNLCKLQYPSFLKTLNRFDILCLQETHISNDDTLPIPEGFKATPHCRKISSNNRYFGGFLLLIRKSISKGVSIDKSFDIDTLRIKFHKSFFGLNEDRTLLFTYATPLSSCYTKSRTENSRVSKTVRAQTDPVPSIQKRIQSVHPKNRSQSVRPKKLIIRHHFHIFPEEDFPRYFFRYCLPYIFK